LINYKRNKTLKETEILKFEGITFTVSRRKVKYPRIEFKSTGPILIISKRTDPVAVLEENKKSILKKCFRIKSQVKAAQDLQISNRTDEVFIEMVAHYIDKYTKVLKVKHKEIKYRKMKRRWGSCRSTGVITLNSYLRFVPEELLAYIVFHELVHLNIRGHNRQFKAAIAREFPDYRTMDKELTLYGFRLLS
jgi:predicted metal-dependent hydrolase